ncbi:hypothetical protein SC206_02565 [Rouxiella sp. T17]|uniref:hypothetical protein n=1 Tax=Rouxiella sp. T17 TaxID=3085684 RepID=UPI002FC5F81F
MLNVTAAGHTLYGWVYGNDANQNSNNRKIIESIKGINSSPVEMTRLTSENDISLPMAMTKGLNKETIINVTEDVQHKETQACLTPLNRKRWVNACLGFLAIGSLTAGWMLTQHYDFPSHSARDSLSAADSALHPNDGSLFDLGMNRGYSGSIEAKQNVGNWMANNPYYPG